MEPEDFLPDVYLTPEANRQCVEIMKKTGVVPQPATDSEAKAIVAWLNYSKKDMLNLMTHVYKDCVFQKRNGSWVLATRNNNFLYMDLLKGKQNG
jgi:hypothetical protein